MIRPPTTSTATINGAQPVNGESPASQLMTMVTAHRNPKLAVRTPTTVMNRIGRYDESDDALMNALSNGYSDPEGTVYRRVKLYTEGAKGRDQRRQLVSFLRKVVAAYPGEDHYRASLGKALFENRDCASARPIFAELAQRTPVVAENLNLLALTSWCLGDTARAEDAFRKSLAVNPNQPVVREGLSLVQRGQPLQ